MEVANGAVVIILQFTTVSNQHFNLHNVIHQSYLSDAGANEKKSLLQGLIDNFQLWKMYMQG